MRVLVTGARGKVGRAAVAALQRAGHEAVATDLAAPDFDTPPAGTAAYVKADLTDPMRTTSFSSIGAGTSGREMRVPVRARLGRDASARRATRPEMDSPAV